jgi:hypothetical protein
MVDFSSWSRRAVPGGGPNGADARVAGGAILKLCVYQRFRCSSFGFRILIIWRGSKQDRKDLNTDFHGLSTRIFTEKDSGMRTNDRLLNGILPWKSVFTPYLFIWCQTAGSIDQRQPRQSGGVAHAAPADRDFVFMSRQFKNGRATQASFQSGPITRIELRMFHTKLESYFAIGRQVSAYAA